MSTHSIGFYGEAFLMSTHSIFLRIGSKLSQKFHQILILNKSSALVLKNQSVLDSDHINLEDARL